MPDLEYRYAPLEYRETEDGMGTVAGTVIRYGDLATLPFGQERVLPGAFGDLSTAELYADRMHQRDQPLANTYAGLRIDDNAERLYGEIDLPNTSYGRDTQEEVKTGRLRGLSIAFRAFEDDYIDGVRVVKEGRLYGWGVVDKPAYPQSVAAMRSWAEYRSEYGLEVRQQRAAERSVIISGPAGAGKTQRAQELIAELQAEGLEPIAADFQSLYAALLLVSRGEDGRFPNGPTTRRTFSAWWNTSARRLPGVRWPTICPWSQRSRNGRTGRGIGRWRRCLAAQLARKRLTRALTRSCGGWVKGTGRSVRSVWRRSADGTTRRKSRKRTHGGWQRAPCDCRNAGGGWCSPHGHHD